MAKKYLLYIHDERFASEEQKSALVNELLRNRYEDVELPVIIQTPMEAQVAVKKAVRPKQRLCKHGYPLGECFDKAMDRSCKL